MKIFYIVFIGTLLVASYVSAGGFMAFVAIGKSIYARKQISLPSSPSIFRPITSAEGMKDANNPDLSCGPGSTPASSQATAQPGDSIFFTWRDWNGTMSQWSSGIGPVLTYIADCGYSSNACSNIQPAKLRWAKIDQKARVSNSFVWYQSQLWANSLQVTLPSNMAPGQYLLRQEIIVLGNADGAEFFVNCIHLNVGGSGTGYPQTGENVLIPGLYSNNDPGINVKDLWDWTQPYDFPGPSVSKYNATK